MNGHGRPALDRTNGTVHLDRAGDSPLRERGIAIWGATDCSYGFVRLSRPHVDRQFVNHSRFRKSAQIGDNRPSNQFVRAINSSEQFSQKSEKTFRLNAADRCCSCQRPKLSLRQRSARQFMMCTGRSGKLTGVGVRRWAVRTSRFTSIARAISHFESAESRSEVQSMVRRV